jgi:FkbM family methyltransferase
MGSGTTTGQGPSPATALPARRRPARETVRAAVWAIVKGALATPPGFVLVNQVHRRLSPAAKRRFFYLAFDESCRVEGSWIVDFGGRRIVLPLHRDFELAWISAISFHGYDAEVTEVYERLVRSRHAPRVVFDIGANYGLHSLKFLAHGARVLSFEPNAACHAFLLECGRRNGLQPDIRPVAVGRTAGVATLVVPEGRTYLGTTAPEVAGRLRDTAAVALQPVPCIRLDDVTEREGLLPGLIKIDTEGSELAVLQGARRTLERARPLLVLESWREEIGRASLFHLLAAQDYRLHALRFGTPPSPALGLDAFLASPATNFLARPLPPGL